MKKINVGLIGFGTVGCGVVEALKVKHAYIKTRYGVDISLAKICDKDLTSKRPVKVNSKLLTKNAAEIINNPGIDIVIELIGGTTAAKDIILSALRKKKHVVTANKALLSVAKKQLIQEAERNNVMLRFEASVCGGVPIIKALREGLAANRIDSIRGIVNGTCNYILSEMTEKNISFNEALKQAQQKGYAESDPSLDIEGNDSAHKLAILASMCFGIDVTPNQIYTEGIVDISADDIRFADNFGYAVKLLAIAKKEDNELALRVHPTLVAKRHPLASVSSNFNAVSIDADMVGETLFYGQGSGSKPTASAVISDIIDIARDINCKSPVKTHFIVYDKQVKGIKPIKDFYCSYYIRFSAVDKPGVLAAIAKILANYKISIASVAQKARDKQHVVPIIMLTHMAKESSVAKALKKIDALKVIKKKSVVIRSERSTI
ncbi:MAG: homoserine dehydrogenase [Candidatus Omnitrophota bacterium]